MTGQRTIRIVAVLVVAAGFGFTGCSVANLQAGLEAPSKAIIATAAQRNQLSQPPRRIASYANFRVQSENNISLTVYSRESEKATTSVLMVHGAGGGAWVWEYFFQNMPEQYNLYALSWRGHFDSSPYPDARAADHVRDQEAVLKAIQARHGLATHIIGHSYGAATSVLQVAASEHKVASVVLIAPVVPLDYTFAQRVFIPTMAPWFIEPGNDPDGVFGGMFLTKQRMQRYYTLYAGERSTTGGPSIIAVDGVAVCWQQELDDAFRQVAARDIPLFMFVARYDNVVVPRRQRNTARKHGVEIIELESGHYIPLDIEAEDVVKRVAILLDI